MSNLYEQLTKLLSTEVDIPVSDDVLHLVKELSNEKAIEAILFYGSGLWKQAEADTIYDFYILVNRFKDFDDRKYLSVLGTVLPPNVYYMEINNPQATLRCKYAVMRTDQFVAATSGKTITPQIWARFAQPCRIVYARDESKKSQIINALAQAAITFHRKTFPLLPEGADKQVIWTTGLKETYGAELRSEKEDRTHLIYEANQEHFDKRSEYIVPMLAHETIDTLSLFRRKSTRAVQKTITFFRLMKAVLTFENSVEYALWKIERQSGIKMEASNFQKRYPLIGAWPLVWKLWRKGAFR